MYECLKSHIVVGIGELLWDCFRDAKQPGGAPANVAFHAGQLGMKGLVVSRVGRDMDGDALLHELAERGVPTATIQRDKYHPTGWVSVDTRRASHPVYTIHEGVAWDHIESDGKIASATDGASAVCFGTLAQRTATSRGTIQRVLKANSSALLVYDANLRPPWYSRDVIETSLRRCHVLKLNDEEVHVVTSLLELAPGDAEGVALALREEFDIQIVCLTRGERGCLVLSRDERVDVPGHSVDIVDTVGAGDAFTAAFVSGLLWTWPLTTVAHFSNEVGAMVAGRRGAMPDLRGELEGLRDRIARTRPDS